MPRENRFTIYDALEKSGYFDKNPANNYARDPVDGSTLYKGPIEFPKMMYHPEGETRITVVAEIMSTPLGAKEVGEQKEIIWQIVNNEAEHQALLASGWHDHPAKAIRARVEKTINGTDMTQEQKTRLLASIPTMSSDQRIRDLEAEIARLTGQASVESANRAVDAGRVVPAAQPRTGADALASRPQE